MRVTKLIICLFIFFRSTHSQTDEVSPVYGYHMRYGVQQAQRINWQESLRIIGGSQVTSADAVPHQVSLITLRKFQCYDLEKIGISWESITILALKYPSM